MFRTIVFQDMVSIMSGEKCIPESKISNIFYYLMIKIEHSDMPDYSPKIVWKFTSLNSGDVILLKSLFPTTQVSVLDFNNEPFFTNKYTQQELISLFQALGETPNVDIKVVTLTGLRWIGDGVMKALADYIPKSKLQHLDLEHVVQIYPGIFDLADALPKTRTLKYLNIRKNNIYDYVAEILAEKVKENKSLETLLLGDNQFKKSIWEDVKNVKELEVEDPSMINWK